MRGVNPLKHVLLDEGVVEIPPELEEWLRYWWGYSIKKMRPNDWFEVEGDNLFCTPAPATAETVIELLLENRLQHLYLYHTIVVPHQYLNHSSNSGGISTTPSSNRTCFRGFTPLIVPPKLFPNYIPSIPASIVLLTAICTTCII